MSGASSSSNVATVSMNRESSSATSDSVGLPVQERRKTHPNPPVREGSSTLLSMVFFIIFYVLVFLAYLAQLVWLAHLVFFTLHSTGGGRLFSKVS